MIGAAMKTAYVAYAKHHEDGRRQVWLNIGFHFSSGSKATYSQDLGHEGLGSDDVVRALRHLADSIETSVARITAATTEGDSDG